MKIFKQKQYNDDSNNIVGTGANVALGSGAIGLAGGAGAMAVGSSKWKSSGEEWLKKQSFKTRNKYNDSRRTTDYVYNKTRIRNN